MVEPVTPLRPQPIGVRGQSRDFVTWKDDELRLWYELPDHGVDGCERPLVKRAGNAGTGIAIEDELMPVTAWQ